jgi:hypothetical protein
MAIRSEGCEQFFVDLSDVMAFIYLKHLNIQQRKTVSTLINISCLYKTRCQGFACSLASQFRFKHFIPINTLRGQSYLKNFTVTKATKIVLLCRHIVPQLPNSFCKEIFSYDNDSA